MANFYMTLPAYEIARQVAQLLNEHNRLRKRHTTETILRGPGAYFVDVISGNVIGCSAIHRETDEVTRQFHLCVHPKFRRQGIARKLKLAALDHVESPYVYVTIREDNIPSINLNVSLGFAVVKKEWVGDHHILTLGRLVAHGRDARTASKVVDEQQIFTAFRPDYSKLFYTSNQFEGGKQ